MNTARQLEVLRWSVDGRNADLDDIAEEVPLALTYNRHAHVVMMGTPADLQDLALGFSLTEAIINTPDDLLGLKVLERDGGLELAMTITAERAGSLDRQRRNLTGRTGCGLCGIESLDQAVRTPRTLPDTVTVTSDAIDRAVAGLHDAQPLNKLTGAVHCAAWSDYRGDLQLVREDVGRHNALDKLIGALATLSEKPRDGFMVVSSRASYEMVQKAAWAGAELVVAVSAPTTLAVALAQRAGQTLVGFARPGRHNCYTHPHRLGRCKDLQR